MNNYQNTQSGAGLLKNVAPKGKIAEMNQNLPMMQAVRMKVNALRTR